MLVLVVHLKVAMLFRLKPCKSGNASILPLLDGHNLEVLPLSGGFNLEALPLLDGHDLEVLPVLDGHNLETATFAWLQSGSIATFRRTTSTSNFLKIQNWR